MARVKYADPLFPLHTGHRGATFTRNPVGFSMRQNPKTKHARNATQFEKMSLFTYISTVWLTIAIAEKKGWLDWVSYLPQRTIYTPVNTIGPYLNYVKRNFYILQDKGPSEPLMLNPRLVTYEEDNPVLSAQLVSSRLILSHTFTRSADDLDTHISLVPNSFASVNTTRAKDRYLITIPNISGTTDITDPFISKFQKLPKVDDFLLFRVIQTGRDNGQFFYPQPTKAQITAADNFSFSYLYNAYVVNSPKKIKTGWHVPSHADLLILSNFIGGFDVNPPYTQANKLSLPDSDFWLHWVELNNSTGFSAIGDGYRDPFFNFLYKKLTSRYWLTGKWPPYPALQWSFVIGGNFIEGPCGLNYGVSIRLIKDDSNDPGQVLIDGKLYHTVTIGAQVWLQQSLMATHFEDGTPIPEVPDLLTWNNTSTPAWCQYIG